MFVGATLLFVVQPMVGKMILPLLGGTPNVWSTCMVFFQAALLAGYAYAHAAPRWLGVRRHALLHFVLLLLPFVALPITVHYGSSPPGDVNPVSWLLVVLTLSVGLPFFVVSTSAPLLQKWFAHTGHVAGKDPYFLYGASNLGSFLSLIAYPFILERVLGLQLQSIVWSFGYLVLAALVVGCVALVLKG